MYQTPLTGAKSIIMMKLDQLIEKPSLHNVDKVTPNIKHTNGKDSMVLVYIALNTIHVQNRNKFRYH